MTRRGGRTGRGARAAAGLVLALGLPACQAVQAVDDRLRRIDVLDRAFGRPAPARPLPRPPPPAPPPPTPPLPSPQPETAAAPPLGPPDGAWPGPVAAPIIDPAPATPIGREPLPEARAAAPPDPAARTRSLVQRNPWLVRFWAELSPGQRLLVTQRLAEGRAAPGPRPAEAWDGMGLGDRAVLVFGAGGA